MRKWSESKPKGRSAEFGAILKSLMNTTPFQNITWLAAATAGWLARILGLLMVLFLLAFLIGEGPPPVSRMTGRELAYAAGMILLFGGLGLAWFHAAWGGALSITAWIYLSILAGRPALDWPFLIPALVGAVYLLSWVRLRHLPPPALSARLGTVIAGAVGVFVLLAANEMFGQPPLMSGTPPFAALAGEWTGTDGLTFTIYANGVVSGRFQDRDLPAGRISSNRSWFGKLMHWRTDYAIRGEGYSLLVDGSGGTLSGHLQVNGVQRQRRVVLQKKNAAPDTGRRTFCEFVNCSIRFT